MRRVIVIVSLFLYFINLSANSVILKSIESYKQLNSDSNISIENIKFKPTKNSFKLGFNRKVWIKLELYNHLNKELEEILYFNSPLIEELKVYNYKDRNLTLLANLSIDKREQSTIYPYVKVELLPKEIESFYIVANSKYLSSNFKIKLTNESSFFKLNSKLLLLHSIVLAFLIGALILFIGFYQFSKERSYLYFFIFLALLGAIYFYISGLEQIFISKKFIALDKTLFSIKFNLLLISYILFILSFFRIDKNSHFYKLYEYFIYIIILEVIIFGFVNLYFLIIPTAIVLILVNLVFGVYLLFKRVKEATLFILANLFLGGIALLYINENFLEKFNLNNTLTLYEILFLLFILSLFGMFLYRFIVNKIKERRVVSQILDKKLILDSKVERVKKELNELQSAKRVIKKSINDLVKNNLNLILSMLKMKDKNTPEISKELQKLNKKVTIYVKAYSLFSPFNTKIDMREPLGELIDFIEEEYSHLNKDIEILTNINAKVSSSEALDIAITIANILISSYEDENLDKDKIEIKLTTSLDKYTLSIKDLNISKKRSWKEYINFLS